MRATQWIVFTFGPKPSDVCLAGVYDNPTTACDVAARIMSETEATTYVERLMTPDQVISYLNS